MGFTIRTTIAKACGANGLAAKWCSTLCNPVDCSPLDPSIHGISQARILEWVVISFLRWYSQPRDRTCVSCLAGGFFTTEPPGNPTNAYEFLKCEKWLLIPINTKTEKRKLPPQKITATLHASIVLTVLLL